MWPELLEEILEQDREAWNAVRAVVPLELEEDVLTVGIASRSDLEAFKAFGAAPLREAITAAVGITVRYVPKQLPAGASAPPVSGADSTHDTSSDPGEDPDPVEARLAALLNVSSANGLSGANSDSRSVSPPVSVGEFGDPGFRVDRDPGMDPAYSAVLESDIPDPDEPPESEIPESLPELNEQFAQAETDTAPASISDTSALPSAPATPPSFTRYGEAVVREVLSARFIEELPLPTRSES